MVDASNQKIIFRNLPPRVQIEYEIKLYGTEKKIQLPFVIGVLADLSGMPKEALPRVDARTILEIDVNNFDARLKACKPRVAFRVPNILTGEGELDIEITFACMDDFSPAAVARMVGPLNKLLGSRTQLADLLTYMDGKSGAEELIAKAIKDHKLLQSLASTSEPGDEVGEASEFSALLKHAFDPKSDRVQATVEYAVMTLAELALEDSAFIRNSAIETIEAMITQLDSRLTHQVNAILHHTELRKLEGTWRGLHYLVNNTETDEMLKIRIFNISKKECAKTLKKFRGAAWDQSPLFRKIYEEEYGTPGGEPFGCLVGDYYFNHSPPDVYMLCELAKIAAFSHSPFIAGADPAVMQMASWQELPNPVDLTKIFQPPEYDAWRSLRESEDSRYICLAMPRYLARLPYGAKTNPVNEFDFEEDVEGADRSKYTWANASFAIATNITRAFKLYGWCSRIRGVESGGAVEGLPTHTFPTEDGGVDIKCPTETVITDRREAELAKNGFMPLCHIKNLDIAAFFSAQTLQAPTEYDDPDATANANLGAQLPYLLSCCRFAHYLKCIVRDKFSSFQGPEDMQQWLQDWSMQYVDEEPQNSSEMSRAKKPLTAAKVVVGAEGNPDHYTLKLFLRPHYQLEGLTNSLRLVSKLPSAKGG